MSRRDFCRAAGLALAGMPLAGPMFASAQGAAPAAALRGGGLAEILAMAPASLPWVENPAQLTVSFADIARQLDVTRTPIPDSMDDPAYRQWGVALRALNVPRSPLEYLSFWRADYGFDLFQADQTLELDMQPFSLTLYRGRFDQDAIRATLTAKGYQEIEVGGYTLLSVRDDYEQDVFGPFAYNLSRMNHVVLLEDGTIAASSVKVALAAVLDIVAGKAPSMMDQASIAMTVEQTPEDLVSATMVSGTMLSGNIPVSLIELGPGATPDVSAIATEVAATSEMPPVAMALLGATAGGPLMWDDVETPAGVPDARAVALVLMLTPAAAEVAVSVIEDRLATGTSVDSGVPYSEWFPAHEVVAVPSRPVVLVELTLGPETPANILTSMLDRRDLGFLAW